MSMSPIVLALVGGLLAAWLVLACWAILSGLSMRRAARQAHHQTTRLGMLLQSAPAIPVLVRPDGRLEAPERLASWLGRDDVPTFLSELLADDGGLEPEHAKALGADIKAAQRGGKPFVLPVRALGVEPHIAGARRPGRSRTGEPGRDRAVAVRRDREPVPHRGPARAGRALSRCARSTVRRHRSCAHAGLAPHARSAAQPRQQRLCPCRGRPERAAGDRAGHRAH